MTSAYGKQTSLAGSSDSELSSTATEMVTAIKRRKERWERGEGTSRMRLTERDQRMLAEIWRMRYATCDQLCALFFSPGAKSNCQRRLTLLFVHGFVEKVPGRGINEPDVYRVGRSATAGLRLLRRETTERDLLRRMRAAPQLDHVLAINDVRCRFALACKCRGLVLADWRDQSDLAWLGRRAGFIPDAFFAVQRRNEDGLLTAAGYLEVERSPRGPRAILAKYRRIADFYRSGEYARLFGYRTLRVLILTSAETVLAERNQVAVLTRLAESAGLRFAMLASLRDFLAVDPDHTLRAPVFRPPGAQELRAFGELEAPS